MPTSRFKYPITSKCHTSTTSANKIQFEAIQFWLYCYKSKWRAKYHRSQYFIWLLTKYFTNFMHILWKFCWKTDIFKFFNTAFWQILSHNLRGLHQIVGQRIRENIGDDFFGILVYFFIIEKSFLTKPSNSRTKLGKKSGYTCNKLIWNVWESFNSLHRCYILFCNITIYNQFIRCFFPRIFLSFGLLKKKS